ncbi:BsuPI-related putative proteinase inhibitor [Halobaculum sp. CBA1158]|uniref:BsuPI-related putative proteinase inhibitor n=1 Tax=Halobaculum sp. CBA1158 TaxID=2904243 RepID=UPI001F4068D7|nr:BsuPI-related putative proteinase inhibitor [Halobaculum sp. CBA1158]UIO99104.1 BsuPI-related putative proteinase inhibitor [Halobaculum sp. CBA1158]
MTDTIDASLTVAPTERGVDLTLTVENTGTEPVELSFADGQRAEFVARGVGDEDRAGNDDRVSNEDRASNDDRAGDDSGNAASEAWRWSEGRAFAMALGSDSLEPGERVAYDAEWPSPPAGEYEVTGSLSATNADATASMTVVVPAE